MKLKGIAFTICLLVMSAFSVFLTSDVCSGACNAPEITGMPMRIPNPTCEEKWAYYKYVTRTSKLLFNEADDFGKLIEDVAAEHDMYKKLIEIANLLIQGNSYLGNFQDIDDVNIIDISLLIPDALWTAHRWEQ